MKKIKFITTFSKKGYDVYGKLWIETFLDTTAVRDDITAKIYINGMDVTQFNFGKKIEIVDFDAEIPQYNEWVKFYNEHGIHKGYERAFAFRFAYKAFVMMDALKTHNDEYIIWLDADCIFKSKDYWDNFPEKMLNEAFVACQFEHRHRHVESGIVVYNSSHSDKQAYLDKFESYYMDPLKFNSLFRLFDGYVVYESIVNTKISHVDLNLGYSEYEGLPVADPNFTFLNPELNKRFYHNIGHTAKKNYNVDDNVINQLVYEVDSIPEPPKELTPTERKLFRIDYKLERLKRKS